VQLAKDLRAAIMNNQFEEYVSQLNLMRTTSEAEQNSRIE
jgi:hypothetical protein